MDTAHGVEELGLCFHGHACQADARAATIGLCLAYGQHALANEKKAGKIFCEARSFVAQRYESRRIFWPAIHTSHSRVHDHAGVVVVVLNLDHIVPSLVGGRLLRLGLGLRL